MVGAELAPQVGRRDHATAATAKDDDFFSPVECMNVSGCEEFTGF